MSAQIKNILHIGIHHNFVLSITVGAGGKLGPSVLSAFASDPHFTTTILTRNSSTFTFPSTSRILKISDEYPENELLGAFKDQDAIICTIATASAKLQERFIDVAIKAGVQRFVPSDFGSDVRNGKTRAILPSFLQGKLDTVEYLKSKEKEGLTWTSFVTGPFFDLTMAFGYMGFDLKQQEAVLYDDGNTTWSTTILARIGLAVKNAMLIPEQTANKYMFIDSFTVSQKGVLAAFEKASGKQWEVSHADLENDKKDGVFKSVVERRTYRNVRIKENIA